MNYLKWSVFILALFVFIYFAGPRPDAPLIHAMPETLHAPSLNALEEKINNEEQHTPRLKPDNQARIVWADSLHKQKTPYSIVYLHGFSASQAEGHPIHQHLAQRYGCNLYLSRLYAHGLDDKEPLLYLTPEKLIQSAKAAIAMGREIGEQVILMSTSTGGTLSLMLAGSDPSVAGLILYSPNVDLYDKKSFLLTQPWGLQLARLVMGGRYYTFLAPPAAQQYWNTKYRIEALIALKSMINASMHQQTFQSIHQPVFMGYYYKDESHQDDVVSVPRMLEMFGQLGTPAALKRKMDFPQAGFHVIGSSYWTSHTSAVENETCRFLEEVMHLNPIKNN